MNELVYESAMMLDHLVGIRRKLHMRPELSYGEQKTSEIICEVNRPGFRGGSTL